MRSFTFLFASTVAVAAVATPPNAFAGEASKAVCQGVGPSVAPEKLGDRDSHAITTGTVSCHIESGPLNDGVATGSNIFEWDKTTGTLVSASGVVRQVGATVVYQYTEGKIELTIADGKVTGFTGTGKGRWQIASGTAAALAGKTFNWTSKTTGPGQFETVWTPD